MARSWMTAVGLAAVLASGMTLPADDDLEKRASWKQPTFDEARAAVDPWLAAKPLDDATRARAAALWAADSAPAATAETLDRLAATVAIVDPGVQPLLDLCAQTQPPVPLPSFAFLQNDQTPPLVRNNLRLYFARWLTQHKLYDEGLTQIDGLQPADVLDPALLLFCQGVCQHQLLKKDACLASLAKLAENKAALPRRYQTLLALLEADLAPLKPDSLDEVSRLMDDIERRLAFGRAGKRVRQQEDDVIAKLDKMIEEIEEQQKQRQQQADGAGKKQSSQPMQDSQPGGGSGPGEVEQKRTGTRSGWGNLPPKQRQEALQQISKDLPAHYREVIEEYFRKLAREGNN